MRLPSFRPAGRRSRGFTLIELMIAVAILGILASIAVPSFREMIAGQRVRSAATDVHGALLLARSEAMKRNRTVSVTRTDASDWTKGWTVGITGTVFLRQDAYSSDVLIDGLDSGTVGFEWTGRPTTATNDDTTTKTYTFKVYSSVAGVSARCISLSLSGMPESKSC